MLRKERKFISMILAMALVFSFTIGVYAAPGDAVIHVGGAGNTEYPATHIGLRQALEDIAAGGTIYLDEDVLADDDIPVVSFSKDGVTIDGQGHSVIATDNFTPVYTAKQGVFNIRTLYVELTLKNMIIDANSNAAYSIFMYRAGGDMQGGLLIIEDVTMANTALFEKPNLPWWQLWGRNYGGYGALINTSNLKAINPTSYGLVYGAFNVDIGANIPADEGSKLEIVGESNYEQEVSSAAAILMAGRGNIYNIVANKEENVTVIDNGLEIKPIDWNKENSNNYTSRPYPNSSLPTTELYKYYFPQTTETIQYDTDDGTDSSANGNVVRFGIKPAKMKTDDFKYVKEVKYNWALDKEGSLSATNVPSYNVKLTSTTKEEKYYVKGKVWIKNFRNFKNSTGKVTVSLAGEDKEIEFTDLAAGDEIEQEVKFEVDNTFDVTANTVELKLEADNQFDYTISDVPVIGDPAAASADMPFVEEIDKTVTVEDDHYTFTPAFTATWTAAGVDIVRLYSLPAITSAVTNTASVTLEDGSKLEDSVTLTPVVIPTVNVTFLPGTNGSLSGTTAFTVLTTDTLSNQGVVPPTVTPDTGYVFTGWTPNFVGTDIITSDVVYVAQYEPANTGTTNGGGDIETSSAPTTTQAPSSSEEGESSESTTVSEEEISDVSIPEDKPADDDIKDEELPKTGGLPLSMMMVFGSTLAGAGIILKNKK